MINKWKTCCISPAATIAEALRTIDESSLQIALVVEDNRLIGTLTDGDIRRALLVGISLQDSVVRVMNTQPTTAALGDDRESVMARMRRGQIRQMPILDAAGTLVGMEILDELLAPETRKNPVLLMAGGLGKRLAPLTEQCPKPMLQIGGRPILETILLSFIDYGFKQFYISVNHKADVITQHFGDGSCWGVRIEYIHEDKRLGTAGALSLLPTKPALPLIVMNADILTKVNFNHLLEFHRVEEAKATMCIREYEHQVPYGVIKLAGRQIIEIQEKPMQKFFVNAGIYVLDPDVLDLVPKDEYVDMTSLFERVVKENWTTAVFPLHEYWLDIGCHPDLSQAKDEFDVTFK
jgi:dTDP-glucose pyrophosphorylase/predicted transcriptional regulator